MKSFYNLFLKIVLLTIPVFMFSCGTFNHEKPEYEKIDVRGVITRSGRPADNYQVKMGRDYSDITENGFYHLKNIPRHFNRIYIRKKYASKPRLYPDVSLPDHDVILSYEIIPYFAADHGPFHYDLRLHRSWGNSLDDPFDTASLNGIRENTKTASGILLKPVYGIGLLGEAVWTVPGFAIGWCIGAAPQLFGEDFYVFGLNGTLLAGYLPIEGLVKVIEVPVKTLMWPLDRLVATPARKRLENTRKRILDGANLSE